MSHAALVIANHWHTLAAPVRSRHTGGMSETVLLVLITGLITLSASFGGIILSQRHERRKVYREKLETIIERLYEDRDWLDLRENFYLWGDLKTSISEFSEKEPYDRAGALGSLFFVEDLGAELVALSSVRLAIKQWQLDQRRRRMNNEAEWRADEKNQMAHYQEQYGAYQTALTKFEIKARVKWW